MLRELQVQEFRPIPAQYKAAEDMVVGMGVVIDGDEVKFPTDATATNVFVVDKEREATGANAGLTQFSDYFADFMTIKEGEFVKLHAYAVPDRFAVDQVDDGVDEETTYLAVGTDGKWAESATATKFAYRGEYNDAGHKLALIEVVEVVEVAASEEE